MKFKIGIYARVSTEEQAENPEGSIKNQEQRLRDYVRFRNSDSTPWGEIVEVFVDPGLSAKDMRRPAFQRLLQRIRTKEINLVLVTDLSRFTRSTKDFSVLWDFMSSNGCKFQSLRENFDSTTAAGEMIMFTLANFAQFERKQTAERISASFLARAKRGLYNGGSVPLGYRINAERVGLLLIHEEEAKVVRRVFRTFLEEGTLSATARRLNQEKVELRKQMQGSGGYRGGVFRVDTVYGILTQKAYVGVRVYSDKGETREARAAWPGIVDEVLFDRVQKILSKNKSARKPYTRERYPYLLTGLCYCKACGDRMVGKSAHGNGGKIGYYDHGWAVKSQSVLSKRILHCEPQRVLAKKLEPVVWDAVKEFLTDAKVMEDLLGLARKGRKAEQPENSKIERKLAGLRGQIGLLSERLALLPKDVDPAPIYEQLAKMQRLVAKYEEQLRELGMGVEDEPIDVASLEKFAAGLRALLEKEEDPRVKTAVIQKVVDRVLVTKNGVEIIFHAGKTHYSRELRAMEALGSGPLLTLVQEEPALRLRPQQKALPKYREGTKKPLTGNLAVNGSNSLQFGGAKPKLGKSSMYSQQVHDIIKHSIKSKSRNIAEFKAFYESGLSLRQIEARTGLSKTKIRQELERSGVAIRDFSRGSKQKHDLTQVMKSGTTPFGYTYLEGKLVVEPSEYRIVLEISRRMQSGESLRSIARRFNDRKVPTRFGKKWNHEVIKKIHERHQQEQAKEK